MVATWEDRILKRVAKGMSYEAAFESAAAGIRGTEWEYQIPSSLGIPRDDLLERASKWQTTRNSDLEGQEAQRALRRQGGWNPVTGGITPRLFSGVGVPLPAEVPIVVPQTLPPPDSGTDYEQLLLDWLKTAGVLSAGGAVGGAAAIAALSAYAAQRYGKWFTGGKQQMRYLYELVQKHPYIASVAVATGTLGLAKGLLPDDASSLGMAENYGGYGEGFDWGDVLQILTPKAFEDELGLGSSNRPKKIRRMNPANAKAATRASRRLKGTRKLLRKIEAGMPKVKSKGWCPPERKKRCD